jgi:hypothetical protein
MYPNSTIQQTLVGLTGPDDPNMPMIMIIIRMRLKWEVMEKERGTCMHEIELITTVLLDALSVITPITRTQKALQCPSVQLPPHERFMISFFFAGFQTWHRDHSFVSSKKFPELTSTRA